jgi:flavodoxin
MNVGIIVYSLGGHTLSVSRRLEEALTKSGHQASLIRLETVGPARASAEDADLKAAPAVDSYDAVVFCTPVRGGVPASPMRRYLEQIPTLAGKKVACMVTHFFPPQWGASQTIALLKATCESKGASFCGSGSVRWFLFYRGRQLEQVVNELCRSLK